MRGIRIISLLAVAGLFAACTAPSVPEAPPESAGSPPESAAAGASEGASTAGELPTVRVPWEVEEIDIGKSGDSGGIELAYNAFEGLVSRAEDGHTIVPGVAESWEVADDGVTWTFHLRKDAKFSDGTPVTADTFVYSWRRVADPETAADYAGALYVIKGFQEANEGNASLDSIAVRAIDDYTLEAVTAHPAPYFLTLLATTWATYAQPQHVIEQWGEEWVEAEHIVTNGPFMVTSYKHDEELVLEPNPHYWGPKPEVRVVFKIFGGGKVGNPQAMAAYEAGELDMTFVPAADVERVQNDPVLSKELVKFPSSEMFWITIDVKNPPLDNLQLRQALYCGIDREAIANDVLKGAYAPAWTTLPEQVEIGYNPEARIDCTIEDAKKLLAEAGYPNGEGLREIELTGPAEKVDLTAAMQALQSMWKENLGVDVRINALSQSARFDWRRNAMATAFDLYDNGWLPDYNDPFNWHNLLFGLESPRNWGHFDDPEFQDLIQRGAQELDEKTRMQLHQDAEKILVQKVGAIPYMQAIDYQVRKPWLEGLITTTEMRNYRMPWTVVKPH